MYHVCRVEPNSKILWKLTLSALPHLVHSLWLLADKPVCIFDRLGYIAVKRVTYLHECLWIVTSPLFEFSPFREASKPCKGWGKCDAMIDYITMIISVEGWGLPLINIIKYLLCSCCWMFSFNVVVHPCDKMVLEGTFD
jgi:hypothetical protein